MDIVINITTEQIIKLLTDYKLCKKCQKVFSFFEGKQCDICTKETKREQKRIANQKYYSKSEVADRIKENVKKRYEKVIKPNNKYLKRGRPKKLLISSIVSN